MAAIIKNKPTQASNAKLILYRCRRELFQSALGIEALR
jgi:hypothetical protein